MRTLFHLAAISFLIFAGLASSAQGAIMVSALSVNASPGGAGLVQVTLTNDSAVSQTLSAFSIELAVGGGGTTFTSVDDQTALPYVFGASGTGVLSFNTFPNTTFIASDVFLSLPGFITLSPGETVGLSRVAFAVDPFAAAGSRSITFVAGASTQFVDGSGNPIGDAGSCGLFGWRRTRAA
jgi:hypothetical protein